MTIDEAITNLECLKQSEEAGLEEDEIAAIELGIEALQRIQKLRTYEHFGYDSSLQGETKD